ERCDLWGSGAFSDFFLLTGPERVLVSFPKSVPKTRQFPMKQISDLLRDKGRDVWSLTPDTSVYDAIDQMAQKEVGALLVIKEGQLIGIVSERDYARKVILKGRASRETMVWEIMSSPVICASPEFTVQESMSLMTEKRIRHLPVKVGEKVV